MTFIPDNTPYPESNFACERLLAIGWLDAVHVCTQGAVPREFIAALAEHLRDPFQLDISLGYHECDRCPIPREGVSHGDVPIKLGSFLGIPLPFSRRRTINIGQRNLLIPAQSVIYIAPSTIIHSITAHAYAPPNDFIRAVLECPPQ